ACATAAQSQPGDDKRANLTAKNSAPNATNSKSKRDIKLPKGTVWNLDGGIFFASDGSLPSGSCFRISGNAGAPDFFSGLKRIDTGQDTRFIRDGEDVTEFPAHIYVGLQIHDIPCAPRMDGTGGSPALTREMMSTLKLQLFWKTGVNLR